MLANFLDFAIFSFFFRIIGAFCGADAQPLAPHPLHTRLNLKQLDLTPLRVQNEQFLEGKCFILSDIEKEV